MFRAVSLPFDEVFNDFLSSAVPPETSIEESFDLKGLLFGVKILFFNGRGIIVVKSAERVVIKRGWFEVSHGDDWVYFHVRRQLELVSER